MATTQIYHKGKLRTASDTIWSDDWNMEDEIDYRRKNHISLHHDRY